MYVNRRKKVRFVMLAMVLLILSLVFRSRIEMSVRDATGPEMGGRFSRFQPCQAWPEIVLDHNYTTQLYFLDLTL